MTTHKHHGGELPPPQHAKLANVTTIPLRHLLAIAGPWQG